MFGSISEHMFKLVMVNFELIVFDVIPDYPCNGGWRRQGIYMPVFLVFQALNIVQFERGPPAYCELVYLEFYSCP